MLCPLIQTKDNQAALCREYFRFFISFAHYAGMRRNEEAGEHFKQVNTKQIRQWKDQRYQATPQ
jgi:hypothetical protein